MPINSRPTLIDCFSGAGGMSLGFIEAGFSAEYALDNDSWSVETYRNNLDENCYCEDIQTVSKKSILLRNNQLTNVDVIVGGPPCQGFSVQRRGSDDDPRNKLVLDFIRLCLEFRPRFIVLENVGGLLSTRGQNVLHELKTVLRGNGYYIHIKKLNAYDYGLPQIRKRVFIVAELVTDAFVKFDFPPPQIQRRRNVRGAIYDIMNVPMAGMPNHVADRLSKINLERISILAEGQSRADLPEHLRLRCHSSNVTHRHLDVYGRMSWDLPSPTITARFDSFSRGKFGHPELNRTITLREGARLQGFPDTFVFVGTKVQVARQIGNAVPPPLAKALAESIIKCL